MRGGLCQYERERERERETDVGGNQERGDVDTLRQLQLYSGLLKDLRGTELAAVLLQTCVSVCVCV